MFLRKGPKKNLFCHPVFPFLYYICNSDSKIYFVNTFKNLFRSDSRIYFVSASFFSFFSSDSKIYLTIQLVLLFTAAIRKPILPTHLFFLFTEATRPFLIYLDWTIMLYFVYNILTSQITATCITLSQVSWLI